MKRGFTRDGVLLSVASLVVALLLWLGVSVQSEPSKQREFTVPLRRRGLSDDLFVTSIPATVAVLAEGTPEELDKIKTDEIEAFVDLSNARVQVHKFAIQLNAPTGLSDLLTLRQTSARVDIARKKTIDRDVQIQRFSTLPSNIVSDDKEDFVEPKKVTLEGPEENIDLVRRVVARIDLSKVRPGGEYEVPVQALGENDRPIAMVRPEPQQVTVRIVTSPAPAERFLLVVGDFKGQPALGFVVKSYDFSPRQIQIRGTPENVSRYSTIQTEPIDLTGLRGTSTKIVRLKMPPRVRVARDSSVRVHIVIAPAPVISVPVPPIGTSP